MTVATTASETPRRKRRKIKFLWIAVFSTIGLVLLLAIGAIWYQANLQRQIDAELAKIRARDEPVTVDDLAAQQRVPTGVVDQTQAWVDVLQRISNVFDWRENPKEYDLLESEPPTPDQPWPDEPKVSQIMGHLAPMFQKLESLAASPGQVRYPVDYADSRGALLPHGDDLRTVVRALTLRAYWQMYHGGNQGALESLISIRRTTETLEYDQNMVSQLVMAREHATMAKTSLDLIPHAKWSDAQLGELQSEIVGNGMTEQAMLRGLAGQRASVAWASFHAPKQEGEDVPLTFAWTRRADELYYQQTFERIYQSFQKDWVEVQNVGNAVSQEMSNPSKLDSWQRSLTMEAFPATNDYYLRCMKAIATDRAAVTLIACWRYHLTHGTWPTKLADLVPEFLTEVPLDPMDGKPLHYQVQDNEIVVYSVGENMTDEGGISDDGTDFGGPDDVFTLTAPGAVSSESRIPTTRTLQ